MVEQIREWNSLESNILKAGTTINILKQAVAINETKPSKNEVDSSERAEAKLYYVKKGDSLFSIAKKYNVTASDIQKWNGIKSESLKPGMKLKISG
jgi:membrane-bound lytic murein transglycosylase D